MGLLLCRTDTGIGKKATGGGTTPTPPVVTSVTPGTGSTLGATSVTIVGSHFTGATAVKFGTTNATTVSVVSSTHITCKTPAHAAGKVKVTVTTPTGSGHKTTAFQYKAIPVVTSVTPGTGSTSGATSVTIVGSNFTGATAVKFGTTNATTVTVSSSTHITCKTPAHAAGKVKVTVTTPTGSGHKTTAFQYTAVATTYHLRQGPLFYQTYPWNGTGTGNTKFTCKNVGDLVVVYFHANETTSTVTAVTDSGGKITWKGRAIGGTDSTHLDQRLEFWWGVVKSTGTTKIKPTWSAGTADYFIYLWEFYSSLGTAGTWAFTKGLFSTRGTTGTVDNIVWPAVKSGTHGGIWVGSCYGGGTVLPVATTTAGFTWSATNTSATLANVVNYRLTLADTTTYSCSCKQYGNKQYDSISAIFYAH